MSTYKWCFVPKCTNTSLKNTDKEFFTVPKAEKQRKKWFKAARRDMNVSLKSTLYCCEDHFKMEEDMQDFMRYKMIGGLKRLKSDVLPHIFGCQEDRKRTFTSPSRKVPLKRTQQRLIEDALRVQQSIPRHTICDGVEEEDIEPELMDKQERQSTDFSEFKEGTQLVHEPVTPMKTFAVASVQTYVCHRSKGIYCNLSNKKVLSTATSPIKQQRDVMTSPMKNNSIFSRNFISTRYKEGYKDR